MNISRYSSSNCCGCGECAAVCPANAITMETNCKGFLIPVVDTKKCSHCGWCIKCCSFNRHSKMCNPTAPLNAYAAKHSNLETRVSSRSGGIFTAISDWIIDHQGVVYGCQLFDCRHAIHTRAVTKTERDAFKGSKYIQSNIQNTFSEIKKDLKNGLYVLFSGTPCQVAAIKDYCQNVDCHRLLTVDIVCHGVPSPKVWSDYLAHHETCHKSKIVAVDFRDKEHFGWAAHYETLYFADKSMYSGESFKDLFYKHYIIRRSCFNCPYKTLNRTSDITIADCWGIAENYPDFYDEQGVSLVLINTKKGAHVFSELSDISYISVDINKLLQPPLKENWPKPTDYDEFWNFYKKKSFSKVLDRYIHHRPTLRKRIHNRARSFLGQACKTIKLILGGLL